MDTDVDGVVDQCKHTLRHLMADSEIKSSFILFSLYCYVDCISVVDKFATHGVKR